jgi:hypothetical protein
MFGGLFLMVRRLLFVLLVSVFRHKVGVLRLTPARDRLRFLDSIFHLLQEHEGHASARLLMTERRDYFALSPGFLFALASVFLASAVPRQHKLDSLERLRKREFSAHFNRGRSGDEIESGAAIGGSGEGGTGYLAGDPPEPPARARSHDSLMPRT